MHVTLSDTVISDAITANTGTRITLTDTRIPGLSVEVRRSSATFYLRNSFKGVSKRVTLGIFPTLSTVAARNLSIEYKQQLMLGVHDAALSAATEIEFSDYFEQHYLKWCQTYRRSFIGYRSLYTMHLEPRFSGLLISQISAQHITRMVTDMLDKGYSKGFINKTIHTLRSALKRSEELCGADYHPSLNKPFTTLAQQRRKERYLNEAEARRLRDYIEANSDDVIVLALGFLLYTGARRSEGLNAQWQYIDIERQTWFVPLSKSGKPRHIVLNKRALNIVKHAQRLQQQNYQMQPQWLFINPRTHLPFRCIFSRWSKIRTELGFADVRIHDLRHSFASTLVNNGATLYEVQHLLGHSKSQTTERYAHLANHRLVKAASLIDKAYG